VIIPLHAREQILGWLFVGHRVTGLPFDHADLEELMTVADYVSTMLENALLYDEVAVQKTLAETLLHSIPTGIVAIGTNNVVRCFNNAAEQILGRPSTEVMNKPVEILGSRIASLLRSSMKGASNDTTQEWIDPDTNRSIAVHTRRLMSRDICLGAVGLVQDLTMDRIIREKQEQLERASLVAELAATMSHEIRNPLVTIKTFAQLLPERHSDPEFRDDFNKLILNEIDRLIKIMEQIHEVAHPQELVTKPLDLGATVHKVVELTRKKVKPEDVKIESYVEKNLPLIDGDEYALEQCLTHIINNSLEALSGQDNPRIVIALKSVRQGADDVGFRVTIQDNGKGIPAGIRERVFSPFCTTKHSSLGLGLSIVKRTVVEHNGTVHISSGKNGTSVGITLLQGKT